MAKPTDNKLHVFKAGKHVGDDGKTYEFSEAAVREMAQTYDPALLDAPLVVGHPQTNDPAYGWTRGAIADGADLYIEPHHVDPAFAEMVNKKHFKNVSLSVYLPDSPGNPVPGKHYIRHIGFLGAAAPGVKGLRPASFAENDGAVEFAAPLAGVSYSLTALFRGLRDYLISRDGLEQADRVIPDWQILSLDEQLTREPDQAIAAFAESTQHPEITMSQQQQQAPANFAEQQQQLDQAAADLKKREQALQEREHKARRDDAVSFAEGLVKEGRLLPRQQAPVVELLLTLPTGTVLNFAEGDAAVAKPATEVLRELLGSLPRQVNFAEKSGAENAPASVDFAAPSGVIVDANRLELHQKATAYQREHQGVDYAAAVAAVGGA